MLSILKNHTILYVEDEPSIRQNITEYLESYFDTVWVASDGTQALERYHTHRPDAILLDINLPYMDGLSVAKEIRQTDSITKLIMLTAYTEKEKLLKATELKLTKYLIKPVSPHDFKESMQLLAQELYASHPALLHLGHGCTWDAESKNLTIDQHPINLLPKEQKLLHLMLSQRHQLVTYEEIMITLWEDAYEREISINSVKNQVSTLRKKLPPHCIESVYGQGYMFM